MLIQRTDRRKGEKGFYTQRATEAFMIRWSASYCRRRRSASRWLGSQIDASVLREWVVNVGRRDAKQRIAHLLCELALRLKAAGLGGGPMFDFPLTQEHLADATGLTAVHTNRMLQALRKAGLVRLHSSRLTVLDWDALAEAGDFSERYLHHSLQDLRRSR